MAATSDEDPTKAEGDDAKVDSGDAPKTVPLDEHIKLRQKKSDAEKKLAELEAELASYKNQQKPKDNTNEDRLAKLEARDRNRALSQTLGVPEDQAEAVASFIEKAPDVLPEEALEILRKRDPEKFKVDEVSAPVHGQLRPRSGPHPKQSQGPTWQDRIDYAASLRGKDKRESNKLANNLAGHLLAKAMGWDHKLTPIPSKQK